jgi:anti-sigma B factor antagonist
MAATQSILRMHQDAQACTFQVEGLARVDQGLTLRRAAEQALADGTTALRVDLRHCTYMDSTFLGTLLFLKRAVDRRGQGEFALVSPSVPCSCLLRQMGMDWLCSIVTMDEPTADAWTELAGQPEDIDTFKRQVVQAHEQLASLDGPAGETFREVIRCLNKDRERKDTRTG